MFFFSKLLEDVLCTLNGKYDHVEARNSSETEEIIKITENAFKAPLKPPFFVSFALSGKGLEPLPGSYYCVLVGTFSNWTQLGNCKLDPTPVTGSSGPMDEQHLPWAHYLR